MRYPGDRHVLPLFGPWRWAPYVRGKFYWKKYQNTRSFFLSHTSKLYQHKQWNVVPKGTAKIDPSNKYNIFPSFIIDQSWNTLQLKNIVLSFHPPFEPITALFTFTGLWPMDSSFHCNSLRTSTWDYGTCRVVVQWRLRWAWENAHARQSPTKRPGWSKINTWERVPIATELTFYMRQIH